MTRRNYNNYNGGNSGMSGNARFVDFEFFTLDPNVSVPNRQELAANVQTLVAQITINQLANGDLVWLNGVLGLDNDDANPRQVTVRIHKGNVFIAGNEIYEGVLDLDAAGDGDQQLVPLAHVDQITAAAQDVTYSVTLQPDGDDVFLNGPITFTGVRIRK